MNRAKGHGPGMRFAEVRREAMRNLRSGTSRAAILALLTAGLATSLAVLDTNMMNSIIGSAAQFRDRGGSISILTAENSINGRACDALADLDGVRAAGALSESDTPLTLAGIPQNPLTQFTSTPGFATMLPASTGQQAPGLLLPDTVANTLGLTVGDPIHTAEGTSALGGTYSYPDDGRPRGMGYAVIAPDSPDRSFDQCWIDAYPVTQSTTDLLYTAIAANSSLPDSGPTLTQHNRTLGTPGQPAEQFTHRMTAFFPLVGGVLGVLLGAIAIWGRRLEIASALHAGIRRSDQTAILLLEALAWSLAGTATAIPIVAALTQTLTIEDHSIVVLTALQTPAMTASGVLLGSLVTAVLIREQRLFAYFKSR